MKRPLFLFAALLSAITLGLLWGTEIPLGVPGEWVWGRIPLDSADVWDVLLGGIGSLLMGGIYIGLVWIGARRMAQAGLLSSTGWLTGLTLAGFGWLIVVLLSPPAGYGLSRSAWVLYYPAASGYFYEARYREESLSEYLAKYEEDIQSEEVDRRVLHHGTHPPGLFICYRGLIRVCETSPGLVDGLLKTQPASMAEMFDDIAGRRRLIGQPLRESDRAVIWLATLITTLCGAAVVVPLFFLARRIASPKAAWLAAAFWPLVPALAVFLPKSDVLYALFGTLFLAVWWSGFERGSWPRCFLAGLILSLAMLFSLALLPVVLLAGLLMLWDLLRTPEWVSRSLQSVGGLLLAGLIGFLLPGLVLWLMTGMNVAAVWWQNYHNHAEFYQHFPRSYAAWLMVNPLETLLALGAPLGVMLIAAFLTLWRDRKQLSLSDAAPYISFAVVMGLLWISGKNRGEAARLWLVIFPYFVWLSARMWDAPKLVTDPPQPQTESLAIPMLILQMLVCWFTVVRVNGFPL